MAKNKGLSERLNLVIREQFGAIPNRLAHAARISPGTFSRYLEGKSVPGGENLIRIKEATGRSIDWLLTGEDSQVTRAPELTPKEKEYVDKLLRIFREKRERTAVAIMNNLDEFLETPSKEEEEPPFSEKKKGRMQ